MKKHSHAKARMAAMVVELVETLRKATGDPQVPAPLLICLFHIAANREGEYSITELAELMGMSLASASRNVAILGRGIRGEEGLKFVTTKEYLNNRATKRVTLTARGKAFLAGMERSLWPFAHRWLLGEDRMGA